MTRKPARAYDWLLAAVTFIVALALAEIVLRALTPGKYFVWPPTFRTEFYPRSEIMPGVSGDSSFTTNSLGLRARERSAADEFNILAIGGSTTECLYLDDRETWPSLLEAHLNAAPDSPRSWVGNAGRSGHTTRNHRLQLAHLLEQLPNIDRVLVLAGINDLTLRLRAGDAYVSLLEQSPAYHRKLLRKSFAIVPPGAESLLPFERLALWQRVRMLVKNRERAEHFSATETATGDGYVERRRTRAGAIRMIDRLPDLSVALYEFEENLRAIVATADAHGAQALLLTQPSMWRANLSPDLERLLWFGRSGKRRDAARVPYYTTRALAESMRRYNERVLGVCETSNARCIDIAASLPRDTTVFYDDVHFNENGARLVAAAIAAHLQRTRAPGGSP